ncbi:hypothetical protein LCGC14_1085210 [marine sediment metagenome]|uniref:Uncharacterized protein n=1 Tax=marine sediment metagenome TaxID=412755 RepID=A0A0F9PX55_9ZZZZ
MGERDIANAVASNLKEAETSFSVDATSTDGATDQEETRYQNADWTTDYGYYKKIPEYRVAINTKATWNVGAGYEANEQTTLLLGTIRGNGKDSFNSILKNMIIVKTISKDSFAEIIRDDEGILINLKPLNPENIIIVQNRQGRIKRYEQTTNRKWFEFWKKVSRKYEPSQIFHLSHERIADEIHGTRLVDSVKWIIDARNEAMTDMRKLMHRHVIPRFKYSLDTDDKAKIADFKRKEDAANAAGENIYIPLGAVEMDVIAVPTNATLNPITWIDKLNDYFFQAVNVPQIIQGNAKEFTDASGKITYLAYEQSVKADQLYVEEQVLIQLNLEIRLTFPASLQTDAVSDTPTETDVVEEEPIEAAAQPNDEKEELEGKT